MQAARVQPLTVIAATLLFASIQAWWGLIAFGAVMLVGAVKPELNLLDRWVFFVSRKPQQTMLHPKRFASGMGGTMLAAAGLLGSFGQLEAALVLIALTLLAASLQAFFLLCIGCWIFNGVVVPLAARGNRSS